METVLLEDEFTVPDLVARVEAICDANQSAKVSITWDLSRLTSVPWLQIAPAALALGRLKGRLESSITDSIIKLPNESWRRALNAFLLLYTPSTPLRVVVVQSPEVQMSPLE